MAAATVPSRGSLLGNRGRRLSLKPLAATIGKFVRPVRAPLANAASIPLHITGLGCIDAAPFCRDWHVIIGLAVTGLSLIWLEHVIADEP